ncbi:MAG: hypothetical protein IJ242_07445 [Clostridia bacterium]|nr:hypothetical protein [Clostridia bacterium]
MANTKKKSGIHLASGVITLILSILGLGLFLMSFTTNYYTFGGMNSPMILFLICGAIVFGILSMVLVHKHPENYWLRFLSFIVIGCLAGAAILLIGDRVEGIGNCIVTDYDSGHGGEEAIYLSLASSLLLLIGTVYAIIGCFHRDPDARPGRLKTLLMAIIAAALVIAIGIATIMLTGILALGSRTVVSDGQGDYISQMKGTYSVSFNQNNNNLDNLKDYQFLCADFSGIAHYDNRLYCDMKLTLDGSGSYKLFSEVYCVEAGKRCEVGDDTGLGQVITMNAEGTYITNGDGQVTTSVPTHAVFEMKMDTYSSQMKEAVGMKVGDSSEDGVYDSADHPEVLEFVPETMWTLSGSDIVSYGEPAPHGTYTISFNQNNGNLETLKDYQFLCADFSGIAHYDNRLYCDMSLTLDGTGSYRLFSEVYCVEAGKRCEVGDDTGLGQVITMNAEGAYTVGDDGTVTTSAPVHAVFEMKMDTYSSQMKEAVGMKVGDSSEDGVYDSAEHSEVLDFVPETT